MEIARMVVELISLAISVAGSATRPWWRLLWFALCMYISAWTTVLAWGLRLVKAPFHLLSAPARERQIAAQLGKLKSEYKGLQILNHELEKKQKLAVREHLRTEKGLQDALVFEVSRATKTSKLLKLRIRELEEQNVQLQEFLRRKSLGYDIFEPKEDVEFDKHGKTLLLGTSPGAEQKWDTTLALRPGSQVTANGFPAESGEDVRGRSWTLLEDQSRGIAFASSLFSAFLTALVAVIAWQAQDPCMPLVIALHIVVGMSCVKVAHFVSKLPNRLDLDAMVLLSFNSFILGSLASPFFPYIAKYFVPPAVQLWWRLLGWFGMKSEILISEQLQDMATSTLVSD